MEFLIFPRIISNNRVTIPKDVVEKINAQEGDYLKVEIKEVIKQSGKKDNGDKGNGILDCGDIPL